MTNPNPAPAAVPAASPAARRCGLLLAAALILFAPLVPGPAAWWRPAPSDAALPVPLPTLVPAAPLLAASAAHLEQLFDRLDYDLEAVAAGLAPVPPLELAVLPADLGELAPVDRRKALFIRAVLPIVIAANAAVTAERASLEALLRRVEAGRPTPPALRQRFQRLAERYGLAGARPDERGIRRLLDRVDGVPASLALAQAISESGWGTSRFALAGNALFGQWTWDARSGIVPAARAAGATHRVRSFRSLADSTRAYLHNLNTHPAYAEFRRARAAARADGRLPAGADLARHLTRYSERRSAYVEEILALIRQNRLDRFDPLVGDAARYVDAGRSAGTDPAPAEG